MVVDGPPGKRRRSGAAVAAVVVAVVSGGGAIEGHGAGSRPWSPGAGAGVAKACGDG